MINNALGILVFPRSAPLINVDHPHGWGEEPSKHRGAPAHSRTGDLVGPQEPLHRLTGDVCRVGGREDPHLYPPLFEQARAVSLVCRTKAHLPLSQRTISANVVSRQGGGLWIGPTLPLAHRPKDSHSNRMVCHDRGRECRAVSSPPA